MRHTTVTPETDQNIFTLFNSGIGALRISKKLGLRHDLVKGRLSSLGLRRERKPGTYGVRPPKETLELLYVEQGQTTNEIGMMYSVRGTTVGEWLRYYDIPRRGAGRDPLIFPTREQMLSVWDENHTEEEIQRLLGIGQGTLHRLKKKYDLPPKPRPDNSGPNNGHWKGGYKEYYGPNWERQRKACLERDHCTCRRCGVTQAEMNREPDVHHLVPFRTFNNDYERANALTNLVSLCAACHKFTEENPHVPLPAQPDPSLRFSWTSPRKPNYIQPTVVDPQKVVRRYDAGETVETTLRELNISLMTYYRSLKRAGRKPDRKKPIDAQAIARLIDEGVPYKEIADQMNINLATVYRVANNFAIGHCIAQAA